MQEQHEVVVALGLCQNMFGAKQRDIQWIDFYIQLLARALEHHLHSKHLQPRIRNHTSRIEVAIIEVNIRDKTMEHQTPT